MKYPLHLGVTEAGNGEDGRIKSALGIGTLLIDGIGDTIRVSLAEDPECEIPVAKQLVDYVDTISRHQPIDAETCTSFNPLQYSRRQSMVINNIGGNLPVAVVGDKASATDFVADISCEELKNNVLRLSYNDMTDDGIAQLKNSSATLQLYSNNANPVAELRAAFHKLMNNNITLPVIIERNYHQLNADEIQIRAAIELGALLIDGFGDAIFIKAETMSPSKLNALSFAILQAARVRMSKAEYIACPSCGRTMFNLQETLKEIKTLHHISKISNLPSWDVLLMAQERWQMPTMVT
jgi:Enzyme involved in the deoxyxylulose pathway of isoprenoid biosynthesis